MSPEPHTTHAEAQTHQTCSMCGESKPLDEYYIRNNGNPRSQCIPCYAIYNRQQRRKHIEKRKAYDAARPSGWERHPENRERYIQTEDQRFSAYLERTYGIGIDEYMSIAESQDNVCAICGQEDVVHGKLSVDHDHENGFVRGLLCMPCNTGIGKLGDSYEMVQAAADYLNPERFT